VPDVYDADPGDARTGFINQIPADGNMTIAFEDLFGKAQAGDADYNDFIAQYQITETANGDGITQIRVDADALVKWAGYWHRFGIRINSFNGVATLEGEIVDSDLEGSMLHIYSENVTAPIEIDLFKDSRNAIGKHAWFTLTFDQEQQHGEGIEQALDDAPYNPYLVVETPGTGNDIHLIGEQPLKGSINPGDTFRDGEGFPWALLVPTKWKNPEEAERIEIPYEWFTPWRESGGEKESDWYNKYGVPYVPEPEEPVVYVAGYYNNTSGENVASYWEDDETVVKVDLPGTPTARAHSVFVSGNDIYQVGYYTNEFGNNAACYWLNGEKFDLYSSSAGNARANAVYIDGGDVYIAGYINEGTKTAGYWQNGGWNVLHDATNADAADIFAAGGAVYISGSYFNSTASANVACYWVDDGGGAVKTDLAAVSSSANAIFYDGVDVYTAGYYIESGVKACYWINTSATVLNGASAFAFAEDIAVDGGDVYIAGYYNNTDGKNAACYWLNNESGLVDLYNDPVNRAQALGIFILDGDVYVSGYVNEGTQLSTYWQNGAPATLHSGSSSIGYSIFVN